MPKLERGGRAGRTVLCRGNIRSSARIAKALDFFGAFKQLPTKILKVTFSCLPGYFYDWDSYFYCISACLVAVKGTGPF